MIGPRSGFTIVELLVIIVIIGILAAVTALGYGSWQQNLATKSIKSDLQLAGNVLKQSFNFKDSYPTSLYSYEVSSDNSPSFQPSKDNIVVYHHNATTLPHYSGLSDNQKLQLFIDACNATMPVRSTNTPGLNYHTSCYVFISGIFRLRLGYTSSGYVGSIGTPIASNFDYTDVSCYVNWPGTPCSASDYNTLMQTAIASMKNRYEVQGGTYPVTIPLIFFGAVLPPPDGTVVYTPATKYCLEVSSKNSPSTLYNIRSGTGDAINNGGCPADPNNY